MVYVPSTKVVKLAPDVLVYINGDLHAPVGSSVRGKEVYNTIMSVSVDASIDSSPNTCSITLADPRTGDAPWFLNDSIFTIGPMAEVEVLMKGRFFHKGKPVYYPVFWGFVSSVSKSFAGGYHSVQLTCSDMLRWWEVTYINVHPSHIDSQYLPGVSWTPYATIFTCMNPFEAILYLAKLSMQNVFPDFKTIESLGLDKIDRNMSRYEGNPRELLKHWQTRFAKVGTQVRVYGLGGQEITEDDISGTHIKETDGLPHRPAEGSKDSGKPPLNRPRVNPAEEELAKATLWDGFGAGGDFLESEYRSRLEVAADIANLLGYEFYQDVTGEIIFKPPFWNMDVRPNKPVSHIEDIDIISWAISESEQSIQATRLDVFGSLTTITSDMEHKVVKPRATAIDYVLAARFGLRPQARTSQYFRSPKSAFYYAITEMDRANINRFSSNMTIPLRPELRLGYPIYIPSADCFMYVYGISHTVDFQGMTATTTLSLNGLRRRYRSKGRPETEADVKAGQLPPGEAGRAFVPGHGTSSERVFFTSGSRFYAYKQDKKDEEKIQGSEKKMHMYMKMDRTPVEGTGPDVATETSYPASDDAGYEVIGGFRYGRNIKVNVVGDFSEPDEGHTFEAMSPSSDENPAPPPVEGRPESRVGDATQDPTRVGVVLDSLKPRGK